MADVTVEQRIGYAPDFHVVREVAADDAALPTGKSAGVNCAEFDEVSVMVTLLNSATAANVEAHFWSPAKNGTPNGGFVPDASPTVIAGVAAGVRKVVRVGHHDSVFFEVTGITGGSGNRVRVEVAGILIFGRTQ